MTFFLSKFLPLFFYPLGIAMVMLAITIVLVLRGHRRSGVGLICIALIVLWVPATPLFSTYILDTLESRYPPVPIASMVTADAIVVLGGGIANTDRRRETLDLGPSFDRLYHAIQLYRAGKAPLIIVSAGGVSGRISEAEVVARLLKENGLVDKAIVRESKSRNTIENAVNTAAILKERNLSRVILVTSAFHMGRASGVFKKMNIDTVPAATDYQVNSMPAEMPLLEWLPNAESLYQSTYAIKEYIGTAYYRVQGWMD